jgi:precorrin isomerase
MQVDLAKAKVGVDIQTNKTEARMKEAQGEATFIEQTGTARGAEVRAVGLANAEAYQRQVEALGKGPTALVNAIKALAVGNSTFVPKILVVGGGNNQGVLESLGTLLMDKLDTSTPDPGSASAATNKPKPASASPKA